MGFAKKLGFCLKPPGYVSILFPIKGSLARSEHFVFLYTKLFTTEWRFPGLKYHHCLEQGVRAQFKTTFLLTIITKIWITLWRLLLLLNTDMTVAFKSHLWLYFSVASKTTYYRVAATCLRVIMSVFATELEKHCTAIISHSTLPHQSPGVDCWCIFLTIWLLLVWCKIPDSFFVSRLRAFLTSILNLLASNQPEINTEEKEKQQFAEDLPSAKHKVKVD